MVEADWHARAYFVRFYIYMCVCNLAVHNFYIMYCMILHTHLGNVQ